MEPHGPEEWYIAQDRFDEPEDEDPRADTDPWPDDPDRGPSGGSGTGAGRRDSLWVTVAVAVVAAAAGVAIALAFVRWPGTAAAGASPSAPASSSTAPAGNENGSGDGGLPTLSPRSGNGNGTLEAQVVGTVTAVSGTSITIGGNGQSLTAAITGSTKFAGRVRTASAIKVGDEVYAAVTGTPSKLTASSIQDPSLATVGAPWRSALARA